MHNSHKHAICKTASLIQIECIPNGQVFSPFLVKAYNKATDCHVNIRESFCGVHFMQLCYKIKCKGLQTVNILCFFSFCCFYLTPLPFYLILHHLSVLTHVLFFSLFYLGPAFSLFLSLSLSHTPVKELPINLSLRWTY